MLEVLKAFRELRRVASDKGREEEEEVDGEAVEDEVVIVVEIGGIMGEGE